MKPPLPPNEPERLRALSEYAVLDTSSEPTFDDIAQLARQLCQTPTALITLIDAERQWFKSHLGLALTETHRDLSFCAHVLVAGGVMIVQDALNDPRFAQNPLVTGPPHIRFYAGAPLITEEGHPLGTLSVIDYTPRSLTQAQCDGLAALSRQVLAQLELRRRAVTEQRAAASAQFTERQTADRHRAVLESAPDAVVSMDADGRITEFNPAAERIFGFTREEVIGRPMVEVIVPPRFRDQHARGLRRYLTTGESVILGRRIEIAGVRRDGQEFPVELSIQRVAIDEPPTFTGFIRDITDRKELEAQLRHSQKMEALGQLAGGIAHDFNNLLTVILGHAALLSDSNLENRDVDDSLAQITEAAERAANLTQQLLAFGRKRAMRPAHVDLNAVIGNVIRLLQRVLGEDVALRFNASPVPATVHGDAHMLEQVLMNLIVNARDAMPRGGSLAIETSLEWAGDGSAHDGREGRAARFVRLRVADTGSGIAPEHLPRIFEPFFTTKDVGRGTGLGLATVYGIVKQHGGWTSVASELAKGTTFDTFLPFRDDVPEPYPVEPRAGDISGGKETILLIEDDASVRQFARAVLENRGYTVLEAESGVAGRAVWNAHRDAIDLVLTDMVMPGGVTGLDVAGEMQRDRPRLRVVVSSGYSIEMFETDLSPRSRVTFLPKPYRPDDLLRTVRTALDSRRPDAPDKTA